MPRPMPVSKYEALRDMLNVTMHWYGFQMLTMRFELLVAATRARRSRAGSTSGRAARSSAASTCSGLEKLVDQRVGAAPC